MAVSEIRQATVKRKTSETDIALFLRIDGSGEAEVCLLYTSDAADEL